MLSGNAWSASKFKDSGKIPIIRIQNLGNNENEKFIWWDDMYDNRFVIHAGDLLLSLSGSIKIDTWKGEDALLNQRIVKLMPNSGVNHRWFYWQINNIILDIEKIGKWALVNNVSVTDLKEVQIPLPPLPIQKRIAEILDAADALRHKDKELLRKYDELAQAIFIDMFGDPVKNEKGFAKIKLGECLENIQIGPFGTQLHESDYIKNGIPLINPMHIGDLKIKPNHNYSISEEKYLELPQYHLKVDDVILGRRGEMGRCAIITEEQGKCLCGTGSLFLTVKKELLDPLFLVYVLSRKTTKIALENVSAGTTMANLNKNIISDFEIILPNIAKQKDFVSSIKMSEQSIEFTNKLVNKSNHIFDSLLQQAFKGELVK
jgi:type I restriction enzyme S subunit